MPRTIVCHTPHGVSRGHPSQLEDKKLYLRYISAVSPLYLPSISQVEDKKQAERQRDEEHAARRQERGKHEAELEAVQQQLIQAPRAQPSPTPTPTLTQTLTLTLTPTPTSHANRNPHPNPNPNPTPNPNPPTPTPTLTQPEP